nr:MULTISPECIES: DUF6196 family protein [unclassified Microbacterium]
MTSAASSGVYPLVGEPQGLVVDGHRRFHPKGCGAPSLSGTGCARDDAGSVVRNCFQVSGKLQQVKGVIMVSVSHESKEETEQRLRKVISAAELVALDGIWSFSESEIAQPPILSSNVLAVVRDEQS